MYIAPSHPRRQELLDQQARARTGPTPPEPSGEVVAAFPRRSRDKPDQELRVLACEYQGHPYVMIQLWELGRGGYWPVAGKSVSIRVRELAELADALGRIGETLGEEVASRPAAPRRAGPPELPSGRRRPPSCLPEAGQVELEGGAAF